MTGSPLTFRRFSNEQNTLRYDCCSSTKNAFLYFSIHLNPCRAGSYQCQDLTKIRALSSLSDNTKSKSVNTCFLMLLSNLAEPNWVSVVCDQPLLAVVTCIKDKIRNNFTDIYSKSVGNSKFCVRRALLIQRVCYKFHWISKNEHYKCSKKIFSRNVFIFKHIFEVMALENTILLAFVPKDNRTMNAVKFVRYLDTVTFKESITTLYDLEGYIICPSNKSEIYLGSHIFNCSNGSHILFKYVCDGIVDCPNDKSDEDFCLCNKAKQPNMCKLFYQSRQLMLCFSTYYMTKNGLCLKFSNSDKIYRKFNMKHNIPKYRARIQSKLTTYDKSVVTSGCEVPGGVTCCSTWRALVRLRQLLMFLGIPQ